MSEQSSFDRPPTAHSLNPVRARAAGWVRTAMEVVVLALVSVPYWIISSRRPIYEGVLVFPIALLLGLWAVRMILEGQVRWKKCPVDGTLLGLLLLGVLQITPLPRPLLAVVSPATVRLYDRLLPPEPETLCDGVAGKDQVAAAGSTISVYPAATRLTLVRLLAVFALFAVVRNNLPSMPFLRHLSIVLLIQGTLAALVGMLRTLPGWPNAAFPWPGSQQGFMPLGIRVSHAFYLNICIGLAVGVLLYRAHIAPHAALLRAAPSETLAGRWLQTVAGVLRDPVLPWVVLALVIMAAGLVLAQSRGAVLALLCSLVVWLLVFTRLRRLPVGNVVLGAMAVALFAVVLLLGLHFRWSESHYSNLGRTNGSDFSAAARLRLWDEALRCWRTFPVWGTGYGTFIYEEPVHRTAGDPTLSLLGAWADNQYVEVLAEGGLAQLALSVIAIGLVLRLGWQALSYYRAQPGAGLMLGALISFSTVVLHAAVDDSCHSVIVTSMVTALAAAMSAAPDTENSRASEVVLRLGGAAPIAGAALAGSVALLLGIEGTKHLLGTRYLFAYGLLSHTEPVDRERQLELLQTAARHGPDNARLQYEIGLVHQDLYVEETQHWGRIDAALDAAQAVPGGAPMAGPFTIPAGRVASFLAPALARADRHQNAQALLIAKHLVPALRQYLLARDLCPILARPHIKIATLYPLLKSADPRSACLERAMMLAPVDPELAYLCGLQELIDGNALGACRDWRRSLELSLQFLPDILKRSAPVLTADELMEKLFPDQPRILLAAADAYRGDAPVVRTRLREKALLLLEGQPYAGTAEGQHLRALTLHALNRPTEAVEAYQAALNLPSAKPEWRYELASLLVEQGRLPEARRELFLLLHKVPDHAATQQLLRDIRLRAPDKP